MVPVPAVCDAAGSAPVQPLLCFDAALPIVRHVVFEGSDLRVSPMQKRARGHEQARDLRFHLRLFRGIMP